MMEVPFKERLLIHSERPMQREILVADITGDDVAELFSVVEAEAIGKNIVKPVWIRQYTKTDNGFQHNIIANLFKIDKPDFWWLEILTKMVPSNWSLCGPVCGCWTHKQTEVLLHH